MNSHNTKKSNDQSYEVYDWVVTHDGKVVQITADDMPDLKGEDIARLALWHEIPGGAFVRTHQREPISKEEAVFIKNLRNDVLDSIPMPVANGDPHQLPCPPDWEQYAKLLEQRLRHTNSDIESVFAYVRDDVSNDVDDIWEFDTPEQKDEVLKSIDLSRDRYLKEAKIRQRLEQQYKNRKTGK